MEMRYIPHNWGNVNIARSVADSHVLRIHIRPKSSKGSVVVILGRAVEAHVQPVDARALCVNPGRTAAAKRAHANKDVRAAMGMRVGL